MTGRAQSLAVLIDAENATAATVKAIFDEVARYGEANVRRIYGDFTSPHLKPWIEMIGPFAIEARQQFIKSTGKNASDIALVVDAMDLMHRGGLDGFCLVSSDADFTRLAQRLREGGQMVIGFGERAKVSANGALIAACSKFIYVENLGEPVPDPSPPDGTAAPAEVAAKKEPATKAVPIILKAMADLVDEQGWAHLGNVGHLIGNARPDFDSRTYGHPNLSTLAEKCGAFELRREAGGIFIRRRPQKK